MKNKGQRLTRGPHAQAKKKLKGGESSRIGRKWKEKKRDQKCCWNFLSMTYEEGPVVG